MQLLFFLYDCEYTHACKVALIVTLAVNMSDSSNLITNNTLVAPLLSAAAYLHIILIIVPTIVLGIIIIMVICKEKPSRQAPITVFYLAMAMFSVAAVLTYGLLWDISLITDIPFLGECGTYPLYNIYNIMYFSFHSIIALNVGATAVFQFLVLIHGKRITSKWVYIALFSLIITSIGISCIFFNGRNSTRIRGSNCIFLGLEGLINFVLWLPLAYTVPLALTIVFSVLTCKKVKKSVIQPLNDEKSLATSIAQINMFNILLYTTFRLASVLLYFLVSRLLKRNEDTAVTLIISRHLNDASYPATLISILVVHKGIRRMATKLLCARLLGERGTDTLVMTGSNDAASQV